jgi:Listeria/Bacterioides repeat
MPNGRQQLTQFLIELNGGTNYPSAITSYTIASQTITLGTPSKFGFVFDGWYDTANFDNVAVTDIATGSTGDKELYAKWSVDPAAPVTDGTPEIGETVTFVRYRLAYPQT